MVLALLLTLLLQIGHQEHPYPHASCKVTHKNFKYSFNRATPNPFPVWGTQKAHLPRPIRMVVKNSYLASTERSTNLRLATRDGQVGSLAGTRISCFGIYKPEQALVPPPQAQQPIGCQSPSLPVREKQGNQSLAHNGFSRLGQFPKKTSTIVEAGEKNSALYSMAIYTNGNGVDTDAVNILHFFISIIL